MTSLEEQIKPFLDTHDINREGYFEVKNTTPFHLIVHRKLDEGLVRTLYCTRRFDTMRFIGDASVRETSKRYTRSTVSFTNQECSHTISDSESNPDLHIEVNSVYNANGTLIRVGTHITNPKKYDGDILNDIPSSGNHFQLREAKIHESHITFGPYLRQDTNPLSEKERTAEVDFMLTSTTIHVSIEVPQKRPILYTLPRYRPAIDVQLAELLSEYPLTL